MKASNIFNWLRICGMADIRQYHSDFIAARDPETNSNLCFKIGSTKRAVNLKILKSRQAFHKTNYFTEIDRLLEARNRARQRVGW